MKKLSIILLILMVMLVSISAVAAEEGEQTDDVSDDVTVESDLTFNDLNTNITNTENGGTLNLDKDYSFNATSDENYKSGIVINKNITVDGKGHTIDAKNSARIFNITASNVVLKNLIFKNGNATNGGAIYVNKASTININDSTFSSNVATSYGGAIYVEGNININNSIFDLNDIATKGKANDELGGSAIYATKTNTIFNVVNSNFTNNVKGSNYSNWLVATVMVVNGGNFTNCLFANNTAAWGGAIAALGYKGDDKGKLSVINSKFINNTAYYGAAITSQFHIEIYVDNCEFIDNKVTGTWPSGGDWSSGGAIYAMDKTTLLNSIFINNYAEYNGGAVYLQANYASIYGDSLIKNCTFEDNLADSWYGAVRYTGDKSLTVEDSYFINNTCKKGTNFAAGALAYGNNKGNLSINNTVFKDNKGISGGAISFIGLNLNIDNSNFTDNVAFYQGGGIYINNSATAKINNSIFNNSITDEYYIYNNGTLTISKSKFKVLEATINANNIEFNEVAKINGTLNVGINDFTTTLNLLLNDVQKGTAELKDNEFNSTISDLSVGTYTVSLKDNNDNEYNLDKTVEFEVTKASNTLNVAIADFEYQKTGTAFVEASVDGNYTLTIGTVIYNVTVKDKKGNVTIKALPIDNYTAVLSFANTNYTNLKNQTTFNVTKASNTLKVTVADTAYPNNVTIFVEASVDGTYTINVNKNGLVGIIATHDIAVKGGQGNFTMKVLDVGQYHVSLTFMNDNYTENTNETIFNVTKGINTFTVRVYAVDYPDNATVFITASVDGKYIVKVNGTEYNVTVESGEGNTTLNVLNVGDYDVNVTFVSDLYLNLENSTLLTVNQGINTLNVTIADVDFKTNATAYVSASVDGKYTLTVGEKVYNVTVTGNTGSVVIDLLSVNKYTATLKFNDTNYKNNENSTTFNVTKIANTLSVSIADVETGKNATAIVTASVDGKYTLTVNEKVYNVTVTGNTGSVVLDVLSVNQYTATLAFANSNYTNTQNTTTFNVTKTKSSVKFNVTSIEINYGENATVNITVIGGSVVKDNITIDATGAEIKYENNIITISNLPAGKFTLKVTTTPDGDHSSVDETLNITVNKVDSSVEFKNNNITFDYKQTGNVTVTVIGGEIALTNISVVDQPNAFIALNNNVITVSNLTAGSFTLKVITTPDANHNSVNATLPIIVNKIDATISFNNITMVYGTIGTTTVITDATINQANISVVDANANIAYADGVINVSGLGAGSYVLKVITTADDNYNSVTGTANITVTKTTSSVVINTIETVVYPNDVNVTFTVNNKTSVVINITNKETGAIITSYVAGNDNVVISALAAGSYNITIANADNINITGSNSTLDFTVSKAPSSVEFSNIIAFVVGNNGTTTITVTGATVNETGITVNSTDAIISLKDNVITVSNLSAGNYILNVTTTPDANHTSVTANTTITVYESLVDPEFVINVTATRADENVTVNVTAVETFTGDVVVKIGDTNYTISIVNGVGSKEITLAAGDYNAILNFTANTVFNAAYTNKTFAVKPALIDPNLAVSADDVYIGSDVVVVITTNATFSGNVSVKVGDTIKNATIVNGVGNVTFNGLGVNTFNVTATFAQTDLFLASEKNTTVNVKKLDPKLNVTVEAVYVGSNVTVVVSTHPDFSGNVTVNVNNTDYNVTINKGLGNLTVSNLTVGKYNVTAKFAETDNFTASEANATAVVKVMPVDPNLSISVASVYYGKPATVVITTNPAFSGIVNVKIGSAEYAVNVVNGAGSIAVGSLAAGTHTAVASIAASDNFTASEKATTFTVKSVISLVLKTVKVKKSAKKLTLQATLKINKKAVKGKKITFKFNGKKYTAKTNKKGVAKVTIKKAVLKKLKVGKKITYTAKYSTKTVKKTVKVRK